MRRYEVFITLILVSAMFSYTIYHVLSFKRVSIGVVYSDPYSEEEIMSLIDIAQKDINKYSKSIRRNYIFDFKIVYLPHFYRADINLTKSLKSDGIDLIIGFDYSGQCKEVLSFIKENEMLLLTPYSSSDDLINEGDNLFRLRCVDSYQGLILAKMLKSLGIKAIIILRLNISWGANIADRLVLEFTKNGGVILSYIKYDQIFGNCSSIFNSLENTVQKAMNDYENDEIAIVNIGIFDTVDLIKKIETNSTLSNLYWFGSDAIPSKFLYDLFEEDVPKVFSNVKLFCPSQAPAYSEKYTKVNERYKQKPVKVSILYNRHGMMLVGSMRSP